ncbi:MAG TPA: biotin carboxylase N-terminal domain-containing protein, partial [Candidatus Thermoplasmatota archaeon]|nr:biotin carboxylase N-terminal domain-containing protein [Candidatus Thermoplasmatota archaeon]
MIGRLIVANRGEIAVRVFRAARELGIETVGVFPRGDAGAAHLKHCARVERLEGDDPRAAYLDIEGVVAAARRAGADAL